MSPAKRKRTRPAWNDRTPSSNGTRDRDVLMECASCHIIVSGEVKGNDISFHGVAGMGMGDTSMTGVTTTDEIARLRWQEAEQHGHRKQAQALLVEFRVVRDEPTTYIHRKCGGELLAYGLKRRS